MLEVSRISNLLPHHDGEHFFRYQEFVLRLINKFMVFSRSRFGCLRDDIPNSELFPQWNVSFFPRLHCGEFPIG